MNQEKINRINELYKKKNGNKESTLRIKRFLVCFFVAIN